MIGPELQLTETDVPVPTMIGLPYEDVTLTTSDHVKIKAYVIPARRRPILLAEMQKMTTADMVDRGKKEMEVWAKEIAEEDAVVVRFSFYICRLNLTIKYAKSRPTIIIFHANAGQLPSII